MIDAGLMYQKLRKNLGNKNCEFSPEHIQEIVSVYTSMQPVERNLHPYTKDETGIAAKVFDNTDFGYYKVTIERPTRLKAQFSDERIEELRYDKILKEPMIWAYNTYGGEVYTNLSKYEKKILDWCEKNDLDLNSKQSKALTHAPMWQKQLDLLQTAKVIMQSVGTDEYNDFNVFSKKVDETLKDSKIKLSASEKSTILNAVSWYDAQAEKVIKNGSSSL